MKPFPHPLLLPALLLVLSGCATSLGAGGSGGTGYVRAAYTDPGQTVQGVSGLGFESQDIRAMTDQMVRDLLAMPQFGNAARSPRVIIDDTRFVNESNQIVNLNLLLDRLRIELMRAAGGRILFVSRQNVDLVQEEKALKAAGAVDAGGTNPRDAMAGADFRLIGKITSQSTASNSSGVRSNYYQFSFEMLDLNTSYSVWGNLYDLKKYGADDTIYH